MNNFILKIRTIRPVKAFVTFLVGILLLVSQACSSVAATTPYTDGSNSGTKTTNPYNHDVKTELKATNPYNDGANSELRVPKGANINSPYEGGMNNYSDIDPRSKAAINKAEAKAEYLTENAKRNLANEKESFSDVAERGASNVKENANNAADKVKSTFRDVSSDVNNRVKENSEKVRDTLSNTGDAIKNAVK